MKNILKSILGIVAVSVLSINVYAGCNNEPDNNNGDCTYASGEGGNTYFCEDSVAFHDCVKSSGKKELSSVG
ncbi:MAG: hypothetical protein ACI9C9_002117 [Marivirga sp.]|jgi:hypothetical protein